MKIDEQMRSYRAAALDEMRQARKPVRNHEDYCRQLMMNASSELERHDEDRARRDDLEIRNRALLATLRAQARHIDALKRSQAPRKALWLAEDFGRHNLTQDFAEQRYEGRLGALPWLPVA